jgi:hypothetical protein
MTAYARRVSPRAAVSFRTYLLVGAVVGFVVGALLTYSGVGAGEIAARGYSTTTVLGYLGVGLGALGALLAGIVAIIVDGRRRG